MDASVSSSDEDIFLPSTSRRARSAPRRSSTPRSRKKTKPSMNMQQLRQQAVVSTAAAETAADPPTSQQLQEQTAAQQPASCPICKLLLSTVSETEACRAAHVNGCLDAAGTPPLAVGQPACSAIDMTGLEEEEDAEEQPAQEADADMEQWYVPCGARPTQPGERCAEVPAHANGPAAALCCRLQNVGAGEVAAVFKDAEINLSVVPHLNENDLQVRTGQDRTGLLSTAQHTPALCGLTRLLTVIPGAIVACAGAGHRRPRAAQQDPAGGHSTRSTRSD